MLTKYSDPSELQQPPWTSRAPTTPARCAFFRLASRPGRALACVLLLGAPPSAWAATQPDLKAEVSVKETYDSNVYLQDAPGDPANVAAAKVAGYQPVEDHKASFVTSLLPKVALEYKPSGAFNATASYAPDITFYHDASSEDYVAHRGQFNFTGKSGSTAWELLNTAVYIDGNNQGPTFARPQDVPALGGIPIRDRREAFVFRNGFRLTQSLGDAWFVRPLASSYIHDFKTDQHYVAPLDRKLYSYENYIDRQEISGGMDLGYKIAEGTHLLLGYRYGRQDQFKGPYGVGGAVIDSPFDSAYHRALLGVEGSPAPWVKLNVLVGPDIRDFSRAELQRVIAVTPSYRQFDPDEVLYFVDASIAFLPTKEDTITLRANRYEQPAFSSFSMYEDIKNDITWRHRFTEQLSVTLGLTLYIGEWQPPVNRNDWIYTPTMALAYAVTSKFTVEAAYSYDWVDSQVPASLEPLTQSHEYTRHLVTLGLRYAF